MADSERENRSWLSPLSALVISLRLAFPRPREEAAGEVARGEEDGGEGCLALIFWFFKREGEMADWFQKGEWLRVSRWLGGFSSVLFGWELDKDECR